MPGLKTTTFYLYAFYASALVNDDRTNFSEEDEKEYKELCDELTEQLGNNWRCVGVDDFCTSYPELGSDRLLGEVAEYTFAYE